MKKVVLILVLVGCALLMIGKFLVKSDPIILKFGHDLPEGTALHEAALYFADLVRKESLGQVEIQVFPQQSLGTDAEMIVMLQDGNLDIGLPPTSKLRRMTSKLEILDLPYLFDSRTQEFDALDSVAGRSLFDELETKGIIGKEYWDAGQKVFTANRKIAAPRDFEGLKLRVMKSPLLNQQAQQLSAFPQHVEFHQVKSKISAGEIDAQENPLTSISSMQIHQVQSDMLLSYHASLLQLLVFSEKSLEKLSANIREMLFEAAKKATKFQRAKSLEYAEKSLSEIRTSNINIHELTQAARQSFVEKFGVLYFTNRKKLRNLESYIADDVKDMLKPHHVIGLNISFNQTHTNSALSVFRGLQIALDEINDEGGIQGKKCLLLLKDHGGFPARGKANMTEFSTTEGILAIVGGMHSPVVIQERDLTNELKIPYFIPWAAASIIIDKEFPYIYRFSVRDQFAGKALYDKAQRNGNKTVLVLENTGWGKGNFKSISEHDQIGRILSTEWFDWGRKDFSSIIESIKNAGADNVIFVGNSPEGIHFFRGLAEKAPHIKIASHWGITGGTFWETTKSFVNKLDLSFLQTFVKPAKRQTGGPWKVFLDKYERLYERAPSINRYPAIFGSIHAYEVMKIIQKSLQGVKKATPDALQVSLKRQKNHKGIFKTYNLEFSKSYNDVLGPEDLQFGRFNNVGAIVPD